MNQPFTDTICAVSTAPGPAAVALLRLSGSRCFEIAQSLLFWPSGKPIGHFPARRAVLLHVVYNNQLIDEALATAFYGPASYTGEDSLELACHGSAFIQQQLLESLIENGARLAKAGEFTQRAYLNGKLDLSQAEAVADLIAAENRAAHRIALKQMRGGFSHKLAQLRQELIDFAALLELELDFAEEDVEFADRQRFNRLLDHIELEINALTKSFGTGNAIKNGIPVAIVGEPNVGKSTLLNALLQEEKALVSDIAGTTRDAIEDVLVIEGLKFRFIDTAGIRETTDVIESMGIHRTFQKIREAAAILYMVDLSRPLSGHTAALEKIAAEAPDVPTLIVLNKADLHPAEHALKHFGAFEDRVVVSAKNQNNLEGLVSWLVKQSQNRYDLSNEVVVSNVRHLAELKAAMHDLQTLREGLEQQISGEFLAQDLRKALEHLGNITGNIQNEEILGSIFGRFCIGK